LEKFLGWGFETVSNNRDILNSNGNYDNPECNFPAEKIKMQPLF